MAHAPEGYCKLGTLGIYIDYCREGEGRRGCLIVYAYVAAYGADGTAIGSVCCEVEKVKISGKRRYRLCILTIGVLEEYRRSKLGIHHLFVQYLCMG